jgi:hypothetical protein
MNEPREPETRRDEPGGASRSGSAEAPGAAPRQLPGPDLPPFPTGRLLTAVGLTAGALLVLWTLVKVGGELEPEVFRGGLLGLVAATAAHAGGIVFGAALAPAKGSNAAYLASMLVRFVLTPVLAVSLYFLLPVKPQPVLIGAAAGYLVILFADVATVMTGLKSASSGSVGRASR